MDQSALIIFSGLITDSIKSSIYPAPTGFELSCYFFSNQISLKEEALSKGWNFVHLPQIKSGDIVQNSISSKRIKFLQLLHLPQFKGKKTGIYFDHKFFVKDHHIKILLSMKNPGIIIRKTPKNKTTVFHELDAARGQRRYAKFEEHTKAWIDSKLANGYSSFNRVCNTGLMVYDLTDHTIIDLCNSVYDAVIETNNSCCQIFWTILSQDMPNKIKSIEFNDIPMLWADPNTGKIKPQSSSHI